MTDTDPFDNLPAVPGALLGNAAKPGSVTAATFIPQRGMGLTTGQDSTPPVPDNPAPPVPLMAAAKGPAPDTRNAEILPAGPFQAPEFRRPEDVSESEVAAKFARYREQFTADTQQPKTDARNAGLPWAGK